ncbi:NACHT domain-containing protein [Streptomyces sp. NPDC050504]|uniref:NACHT domain-containing protein n=1 Tax=Streptomyces sp. NPDC050504 TaxID=3365618 RepID=UPI0037B0238B
MVMGVERRERRIWTALCTVGAVAALVAAGWGLRELRRGESVMNVVTFAFVVPSFVVAIAGLLLARAGLGQRADTAALGESAARTLADAVAQAEGKELLDLQGADLADGDRHLINVRFTRETPASASGPLARGQLRDGTPNIPAIAAYYNSTEARRLVITGEPGAGKTVLALELLTELIKTRGATDPVPVRLSLAQWDPALPLEDFLTTHLTTSYDQPLPRAHQLVHGHWILPVLDGLDEMDPGLTDADGNPVCDPQGRQLPDPDAPRARTALKALNAYSHGKDPAPLILLCRTAHYQALAATAPSRPPARLTPATRIAIQPVTPARARAYLAARTQGNTRWTGLLQELRTNSPGLLAGHLSTPWRLSLAATVYRTTDPAPLRALSTPQELDEHLLALLIPATLNLYPPPRGYQDDQIRTWLTRIARHLDSAPLATGSSTGAGARTDIHLYELWPIAGHARVRAWDAAFTTLTVILACLPAILLLWPISTFLTATFAVYPGVAAWMAGSQTSSLPRRWSWQALRVNSRSSLAALAFGLALGMTFGVTGGLTAGLTAKLPAGLAVGLGAGLTYGLVIGLAYGLAVGLAIGAQADPRRIAAPGEVMQEDAKFGLAVGLALGLAGGLAFGLPLGLAFGLIPGLIVGLRSARRYVVFLWCARKVLPFHLTTLLAYGYRAGLLRRSGNAYQFRHRELQQWLAAQP